MKWCVHAATDVCPVNEIVPDDGTIHISGLECDCLPCLDGDGDAALLIHHEVILGFPVICMEVGAHECSLDRKPVNQGTPILVPCRVCRHPAHPSKCNECECR